MSVVYVFGELLSYHILRIQRPFTVAPYMIT